MALTPQELEQWVNSKIDTSVEPDWGDQNDISQYRGIGIKYDKQLQDLDTLYLSKINRLIAIYERDLTEFSSYIKNFNLAPIELQGDLKGSNDKVMRLADKWLATKREIEGRTKGYFTRNPVGTVYYIDLDNGSDASPHDGLKVGDYTADTGTGTTTLIEDSELGRTTDDDWNGAYLYNVTRGIGVQITDSAYAAGTWTLTHPTITGQVSGDTYFIIDAWKTLEQYTTVTERSSGDIGYVRANTSQVNAGTADINFDEDGTYLTWIKLIGCDSVVNDPWLDSSDVLPIYDFNDGDYHMLFVTDFFWRVERLEVIQSADNTGTIYFNTYGFQYLKDMIVRDSSAATGQGVTMASGGWAYIDGCTFYDNNHRNLNIKSGSHCFIKNITAYAGSVAPTTVGLWVESGAYAEIVDSELGSPSEHTTADFRVGGGGVIRARNTLLNSSTRINLSQDCSAVYEEDKDKVKGSQLITYGTGTIAKDISIVRSGGALSSAKFEPMNCGLVNPLTFNVDSLVDYPFKVWCKGEAERTITIYIRSLGVWSVYPTASELYVEASYFDHLTNATRTKIQSNDVLDDETTWRAFDVTFTPQQEGFVYLNVYLKKYEASKGCYVDIKPVVS